MASIDALLPKAQSLADATVREMPRATEADVQARDARWTETFHDLMDRLCAHAGIRFTTRPGCGTERANGNGAAA